MRVVLTGAASGIGRATARELARRGFQLVLVDRDEEGLQETVAGISGSQPQLEVVDLSSLSAVRGLAEQLATEPVGVLINNAGVLVESRIVTEDGFELTFAVNTLAPFFLTRLLWPQLMASGKGRVVNVSSLSHRHGHIDFEDLAGLGRFNRYEAYARSKLSILLLTRALARRAEGLPVAVNAIHPGVIGTGLGEGGCISLLLRVARPLLKTPEQGARGLVYLAADPKGDQRRGQYFVGTAVKQPAARGRDEGTAERLYSAVEAMLAPWGALPPIPVPDSSLNGEPDRGGADGTTAQD